LRALRKKVILHLNRPGSAPVRSHGDEKPVISRKLTRRFAAAAIGALVLALPSTLFAQKSRRTPTQSELPPASDLARVSPSGNYLAARHASVKSVFVGLAIQEDTLWVEVVDKGCGFDASTVLEKPSSGLGGMRERAELAGGYLLVRSVLEQGTQVIAALPILENRLERRKNVRKSSLDR